MLHQLQLMHARMRDAIVTTMAKSDPSELRANDDEASGDTTYGIDRISESLLLELLQQHLGPWLPVTVVAEGLPDVGLGPGIATVPRSASIADCQHWVIVDPIDGTRGLMYAKRSAWILTGVAPARQDGTTPTLTDIQVAIQTEVPHPKQTIVDTLMAIRGCGATATRTDLHNGNSRSLRLTPSTATSLDHGFGQIARVFPGCRDVLAAIDDEICLSVGGAGNPGRGITFEDQYISTGGQIAELAYGHDRWIADLRPLLAPLLAKRGLPAPQCCHPYDICTSLIAEELGIPITGVGGELNYPLALHHDIAWAGYANSSMRALIEPLLIRAIVRHIGSVSV